MSNYSYRLEGDTLYIEIKSVLVGGIGKANVEIFGDFSSLRKVVLEDNNNKKTIWEK